MKKSKTTMWGRLFRCGLVVFVSALIASAAYTAYLSIMIEKRFSSRRWQVPSKVFSDVTILYPGQKLNLALFRKKLENLEYKIVKHDAENKGDVSIRGDAMDIFLRDRKYLSHEREGSLFASLSMKR
jgi:penicillin-binding protein 1B